MGIVLTYTTNEGVVQQFDYDENVEKIDLMHDGISRIDLTPLQDTTNLREFNIGTPESPLPSIELNPLKSCANLETLRIYSDQLQLVDITSLKRLHLGGRFENIDENKIGKNQDLEDFYIRGDTLQYIDLKPIASCQKLMHLSVDSTQIERFELSSLSSLNELVSLSLVGEFSDIDLSPLTSCTKLSHLKLGNAIQQLDLIPLASCHNLMQVNLSDNNLKQLDLSPLSSCCISRINLENNPIRLLDITPLIFHPSLFKLSHKSTKSWIQDPFPQINRTSGRNHIVKKPSPYGHWKLLHKIARIPHGPSIAIQCYILKGLGLNHFGLLDEDILGFLRTIPFKTPIEDVRKIVKPILIEKICNQIDNGGTTIGLDLDAAKESADVVRRIKRIASLRDSEMSNIVARKQDTGLHATYYIDQVLLTAYGFMAFTSKKGMINPYRLFGSIPTIRQKRFNQVRDSLGDIGYHIEVIDYKDSFHIESPVHQPSNMSVQMRNYILHLGFYEGSTIR